MTRNSWVNLRGLSVLFVIIIHVTSGYFYQSDSVSNLFNLFLNQISRVAVPVFFVSSGYGLTFKEEYNLKTQNYYKKRVKIIFPYIFWVLVFFFFNRNFTLKTLIKGIITGNVAPHLYFIVVLIIFYILYPVLYKIAKTTVGIITCFSITLCFQLLYKYFQFYSFPYFYNWIFYFSFGIFLASRKSVLEYIKRFSVFLLVIGVGTVLFTSFLPFFENNSQFKLFTTAMRPSVMIYTVGFIGFSLQYFERPLDFLKFFDMNSMNIYYSHMLFWLLLHDIQLALDINSGNIFIVILNVISITILSSIFSILRNKLLTYSQK